MAILQLTWRVFFSYAFSRGASPKAVSSPFSAPRIADLVPRSEQDTEDFGRNLLGDEAGQSTFLDEFRSQAASCKQMHWQEYARRVRGASFIKP
jgi:hypothetical protein